MKKLILIKFLFIFTYLGSFAQNNLLKKASETSAKKVERLHTPKEFQLYTINVNDLLLQTANAPELSDIASPIVLRFPDANGNYNSFYIYNNSNMETDLALENPNIRSLKAISVNNKMQTLHISISTIFGFHATGRNIDGSTYYIDNYTEDLKTVICYNRSSLETPKTNFNCLVTTSNEPEDIIETLGTPQILSFDNNRRNYRLALACTTEYANFHIQRAPASVPKVTDDDKKNIVLAAMNVTLTRLNQIFERELNMHLNLVANNKSIIFVTTDNFSNNNPNSLIGQSQNVITNTIGTNNFDIGHTFSTGAGGLASVGVCYNNKKAEGITGSSAPVGDAYDVDYVAHEMGHQFGANHTFRNSCQFNINIATAYETGSGSTIMSYAGICSPNVQMNVDDYYHYISLKEMHTFLQTATCATQNSSTNNAPTVSTLLPYTIPFGTPFILSTNATDIDGDNLTYTFEQIDNEFVKQPAPDTATVGPSFRSMPPSTANYRSFPTRTEVNNGTTNANGIVTSLWEQLASVARSYNFIATVRDNNPLGGRVAFSQPVKITVANTGPFLITYPNNNPSVPEPTWFMGSSKTITWNVAGTTGNTINTSHVNIKISTDGGLNYTMLLANTPNDGSETVTIPNNLNNTYDARIMIEAVGNIYYTVSKKLVLWNPTLDIQPADLSNVSVYPNPSTDILNISFEKEGNTQSTYSIYDITGKLVKKLNSNINQKNETISISELSSGTYILMIEHNNKKSNIKFVKN